MTDAPLLTETPALQAWSLQGRRYFTESEYIDEERYGVDQLEGWELGES
jgi:hypothetical protein